MGLKRMCPMLCPPCVIVHRTRCQCEGVKITLTGSENQHDSKSSHSVGKTSAATVNRRVARSNLAGEKIFCCIFKRFHGPAFIECLEHAERHPAPPIPN